MPPVVEGQKHCRPQSRHRDVQHPLLDEGAVRLVLVGQPRVPQLQASIKLRSGLLD